MKKVIVKIKADWTQDELEKFKAWLSDELHRGNMGAVTKSVGMTVKFKKKKKAKK